MNNEKLSIISRIPVTDQPDHYFSKLNLAQQKQKITIENPRLIRRRKTKRVLGHLLLRPSVLLSFQLYIFLVYCSIFEDMIEDTPDLSVVQFFKLTLIKDAYYIGHLICHFKDILIFVLQIHLLC